MRRQLLPLVAGLLALCTMTACLEDLGINIDDIAAKQTPLAQSDDPEARKAAEAKKEAKKVKDANKAMDDFYKSGDMSKLAKARGLQPNDLDITAAEYIAHIDDLDTSSEWFDKNDAIKQKMLDDAALARKARDLPPDTLATRQAVAHAIYDAMARVLARGTSGSFNANQADRGRQDLYRKYCDGFTKFEAENKKDPWLVSHRLDFGFPCKT